MDWSLALSALLLGLAGAPHCAAMCGAPCAAVCKTGGSGGTAAMAAFLVARLLSYSLAGGVAAASVGMLATLGHVSPALRPLWTLLHLGAMGLGLYLLWQGRQPQWLERLGRATAGPAPTNSWQVVASPLPAAVLRPAAAGALWLAWPCGLLQSALMVAALANQPAAGAAVMGGFALTSSLGLALGPALWLRFTRAGRSSQSAQQAAVRLAGLLLALASLFALSHHLIRQVVDFCLS